MVALLFLNYFGSNSGDDKVLGSVVRVIPWVVVTITAALVAFGILCLQMFWLGTDVLARADAAASTTSMHDMIDMNDNNTDTTGDDGQWDDDDQSSGAEKGVRRIL